MNHWTKEMINAFDTADFVALGLNVQPQERRQYSIDDVSTSMLGLLEDYEKGGFFFCAFDDECLVTEINGIVYDIFGHCPYGVFLCAENGTIWIALYELEIADTSPLLVNQTLSEFSDIYLKFLSTVLDCKRFYLGPPDHYAVAPSGFTDFLKQTYPKLLEAPGFWEFMDHALEDAQIPMRTQLQKYIETGRFQGPEAVS